MFDHPQLSLTAPAALGAITGDRLTASSVADSAWVHVVAASGARDSVFVVTYTPSGSYHITLQFAPDVPERWRIALAWAASVWEAAIAGSLPAVQLNSAGADCPTAPDEPTSPPQMGVETGMRLYVGQSGHYPAGTYVEATGGPCVQRPLPAPTTVLGQISLNRDKPVDAIPPERLEYLALHEMGHTLGLVAVVQGTQPDWFDTSKRTYTGSMALEAWRRLFGTLPTALQEQGAHWNSAPLYDIMGTSGGGAGRIAPVTAVTIGALMDLGYPATWSGAVVFE